MNIEYDRYREGLRCPIDSEAEILGAFAPVVHELWATILNNHLPSKDYAAPLFYWDSGIRGAVEDDDINECHYDLEEITRFGDALIDNRKDLKALSRISNPARSIGPDSSHSPEDKPSTGIWLDEELRRWAGWTERVTVKGWPDRTKHHATLVTPFEELKIRSLDREGNGSQLLPTFTAEDLFEACFDGLAQIFQRRLSEINEATSELDVGHRPEFLQCWREMFSNRFRFLMGYEYIVGASDGAAAYWMIFDVNTESNDLHCYPAGGPDGTIRLVSKSSWMGGLRRRSESYFGRS